MSKAGKVLELFEANIPVSSIIITQMVASNKVQSIVQKLKKGIPIPPIEVERLPNGKYRIVDGNHRYSAHVYAGMNYINANVHGAGYGKRWRQKVFGGML